MSIAERDIARIKAGSFKLDSLTIRLERRGDSTDVIEGPGSIAVTKDGLIEYTVYDTSRVCEWGRKLDLPTGVLIDSQEFYDLRAEDVGGTVWRGHGTLPDMSGFLGRTGVICTGHIDELAVSEPWEAKDELRLFLPGVFEVHANAFTITRTTVSGRESIAQHPNIWRIEDEEFTITLISDSDGLTVYVRPTAGSLTAGIENRIEEAVWFVLSVSARWQIRREVRAGVLQTTVRRRRVGSSTALRSPLDPVIGSTADDAGQQFVRFLRYVDEQTTDRRHPISVAVLYAITASAAGSDSSALALCIGVETVVREAFHNLGKPSKEIIQRLDDAITIVDESAISSEVRSRIVNAVRQWRGTNPTDALKELAAAGVITADQLEAWSQLRNRLAHNLDQTWPIDVLATLRDRVHMMFLRLIFEAIGYSGLYTDRSAVHWPAVSYEHRSVSVQASG